MPRIFGILVRFRKLTLWKTVIKISSFLVNFAPVSTENWEAIIEKDLKGADYDRKLIWRTTEGFPVKPYYRSEDLANLGHLETIPGVFPFTRK